VSAALVATPALAQDDPPKDDQSQDGRDTPPAGDPPPETDRPPTLDELLGIDEERPGDESDAEVAEQEAQEDLERRLNQQQINSAFEEAIAKMALSAEQLDRRFDTGLGTQRVQEEILEKLEFLLDQARKQKGSGAGSSSSSQSQTPPEPGRQGSQSAKKSPPQSQSSSDSQAGDPPPMQEGPVNTILEEERTEWGHLPQRVRDMLLQGRREKFSSLYEQMTREYYKRLAEEGSS
jgi:hypothetical protein